MLCVDMVIGVPGQPQSLMVNTTGDCRYPLSNSVITAEWSPPEGFCINTDTLVIGFEKSSMHMKIAKCCLLKTG